MILEGLFVDPLMAVFKQLESFYYLGNIPLLSLPGLIGQTLAEKAQVYMFEWSNFDASVQEWEIRFAFQESMLTFFRPE